jgi:hypothetical protein
VTWPRSENGQRVEGRFPILQVKVYDAESKQSETIDAMTRDNFAEALAVQQAKIADAEAKISAERVTIERYAAADKLPRNVDEIEKALPNY